MERQNKRPRLSDNNDTDDFDLGEARARNNLKLKSRFESIFEKYGKDFSSMGDEIDLKTGAIVVDNGHLQEMQNEQDVGRVEDDPNPDDTRSSGELEFDWIDSNGVLDDAELQDNEHHNTTNRDSEDDSPISGHSETAGNLESKTTGSNHEAPNTVNSEMNGTHSTNKFTHDIPPVDPIWQTPNIEGLLPNRVSKSAPMHTPPDRAMSVSPSNGKSLWAGPWTRAPRKDKGIKRGQQRPRSNQPRRKLFSTPELEALRKYKFASAGAESDDSDDPLQDDSYQTPTKGPSPDIGKRANGPDTPATRNKDTERSCSFCKENFSEIQFVHHLDALLSKDKNDDGVHNLEEIRKLRESLPGSGQPKSSDEHKNGESPLISSQMTVSAPIPVSKTPIPKRISSHQRTLSPQKTSPVQQDENGAHNEQEFPDQDYGINDLDALVDDDRFSTTSGLSSIQIESSPAKTPPGKQGTSFPLAVGSSEKKIESEERFSLFSKRPIKVPIFRRTNL